MGQGHSFLEFDLYVAHRNVASICERIKMEITETL